MGKTIALKRKINVTSARQAHGPHCLGYTRRARSRPMPERSSTAYFAPLAMLSAIAGVSEAGRSTVLSPLAQRTFILLSGASETSWGSNECKPYEHAIKARTEHSSFCSTTGTNDVPSLPSMSTSVNTSNPVMYVTRPCRPLDTHASAKRRDGRGESGSVLLYRFYGYNVHYPTIHNGKVLATSADAILLHKPKRGQ